MKRFIVVAFLVMAFGTYNYAQAQSEYRVPELAWGFSVGGVHGTNNNGDEWGPEARGYLQIKLGTPMLLGQLGLGYGYLSAPGSSADGGYNADVGLVDLRLLFAPFSMPNLYPYVFVGIGASKNLNGGGTSDFLPIVPMGLGIRTHIAPGVSLTVNGGYNLVLSDKLDGHTRTSADLNPLSNAKQDGYYGFNVGLAFTIGNSYDAEREAREAKAREDARHAQEMAQAEARRVKQQADADALARHIKDSTDALAQRTKLASDAEARRIKDSTEATALLTKTSTDAEARRLKEANEAEARRLAEQKRRDTVIVLEKGKTVVLRGVNFEFNKATLTKDSERILWRAYNALVANPDVVVVITGHTDNVGGQKFNQPLSLKRAQAVKNWLVNQGIPSRRMRTVGRGQNEPVASNDTEEGRAENRRMEFFVQQ
jgi:outer membrane protein OmpA-like peptidoglycan-associated protein